MSWLDTLIYGFRKITQDGGADEYTQGTIDFVGLVVTEDAPGGRVRVAMPGGSLSGPLASTDNALALWDGAAGDTLKNSLVTLVGGAMAGLTRVSIGSSPATSGHVRVSNGFQMYSNSGGTPVAMLSQSGGFVTLGGSSGVSVVTVATMSPGGTIRFQPMVGSNSASLDKDALTLFVPLRMEAALIQFGAAVVDATIQYEHATSVSNGKKTWIKGQDVVGSAKTGGAVGFVSGGDDGGSNTSSGDVEVHPGAKSGTGTRGTVFVGIDQGGTADHRAGDVKVDCEDGIHLATDGNDRAIVLDGALEIQSGIALDCSTQGGYMKPRRVSQASQPTPASGELLAWHNSSTSGVALVYNDPDEGIMSVDLS